MNDYIREPQPEPVEEKSKRNQHEFQIFTKSALLKDIVTLQAFAEETGVGIARLRAAAKAGKIEPAARFGAVDVYTRKKIKDGLLEHEMEKLKERLGGL